MHWRLGAEYTASKLDRAVGNHLVGVHVGLRARTGLEYHQRKLGVQPTVDDVLRGTHDQVDLIFRQLPELEVRERGTFLQNAECADYRASPAETVHADREVLVRALGLRTPQMLRRHPNIAQSVFLHAVRSVAMGDYYSGTGLR